MSGLTDETKEALTYVLVSIAGGLVALGGLRDGDTTYTVMGGALALVALGMLGRIALQS